MDILDMETKNIVSNNIEKIKEIFPKVITEDNGQRVINFELLKQELSDVIIDEKKEKYQLTWPGKKACIWNANNPTNSTLRPVISKSTNYYDTKNIYIEGDNLEVLKILQESYLNKIKCIYIDPPYNTGNDFIYNDKFKNNNELEKSGQVDENGNRMISNLESNGRFHSDWLSMIYPRLKLSRNLLTDDGVIFISIDENEIGSLKMICDEIFGEHNFIAQLVWSAGRKNDSKYISISHEYILCYFKNINYIIENKITWREKKQGLEDIYAEYNSLKKQYLNDYEMMTQELKKWYKNLPNGHPAKDHSHYSNIDENGIFFADNISWPGGGGPKYDVLHPVTGKPVKIPSRGWLTNENTMKEWIKQGRVYFGKDENNVPTLKSYLVDREDTVPYSVFYKDGRASSKRLADLMGDKVFENPKDEEIIQRLIEFCGTSDNDIVLDFFSGSATTAHSVFLANAKDGKKRKFIMVQVPQEILPSSGKQESGKNVSSNAIKLLDSLGLSHDLCSIGQERIRRAGNKIKEETNANIDYGFRVYKVDSSNMKDVYYKPSDLTQLNILDLASNIKEDRTPEDLLTQVILDLGLTLDLKIEEKNILNNNVYFVENNALIACFDDNVNIDIIDEICKYNPLKVVFKDLSFKSDKDKINLEERIKKLSPETEISIL